MMSYEEVNSICDWAEAKGGALAAAAGNIRRAAEYLANRVAEAVIAHAEIHPAAHTDEQQREVEGVAMADYVYVEIAGLAHFLQLWPVSTDTYRATPVPCDGGLHDDTPAVQTAINLLPAALTQAEMEAFEPGPCPQQGYCDKCRLSPPFGHVSPDQKTFFCNSCWKGMRKS